MPHSTADMISGKGGALIARIQKETKARVQLLPRSEDSSLHERIVTVQGKHAEMLLFVTCNISPIQ